MGKKSKGKDKARSKAGKKDRKRAALRAAAEASAAEAHVADGIVVDLADERRRRSVGATELAARLASLSTVLQRHLAHADSGDGLTRARLSALALLVLGGPRTLGDLAAAERVRPPTMTRLVHAMEADGLVARRPNPDDGRSIIIRATAHGEAQLELGRARQIAPLAEAISDLDRGDRNRLDEATDLLGRVLRDAAWGADAASE
jgi:DNA-binding MarR family transcriptional regulator